MDLSLFKFFWWAPQNDFSVRVRFGRSRSSKIIDIDTNRKRAYDLLLARHSNLRPCTVCRDIADCCAHEPPYYTLILGMFPLGPDRRCWGQREQVP